MTKDDRRAIAEEIGRQVTERVLLFLQSIGCLDVELAADGLEIAAAQLRQKVPANDQSN